MLKCSFFILRFPERRQPNRSTIFRLKANLLNFGSYSKPRQNKYKEKDEVGEINVLASVQAKPQNACRSIEEDVGVPKTRVQKILNKHKFRPYKVNIVHHLHPDDPDRRLVFCNWFLEQVRLNNNFARKVIWSDEAFISSAGIFNRQNTRHWYQENQNIIFEREQQGRFGFSVSCFILDTKIIYRIYEGGLSGQLYLQILQDVIPELLDDVPLAHINSIFFQQDGAPSHNSRLVRPFLDNHFGGRWIGTQGPIRWPARSPDLTILDFFLWSYLKNKIYCNRHNNVEELRAATDAAFQYLRMHSLIIRNALARVEKVCGLCIRQNGRQFEQFN